MVKRVLLASPRGYCAGVERAVETVERALALYGAPVYVRKQIVHNSHVVRELEERGAIFVDSVEEIPEGAPVVFSAHGVAPAVRDHYRLEHRVIRRGAQSNRLDRNRPGGSVALTKAHASEDACAPVYYYIRLWGLRQL